MAGVYWSAGFQALRTVLNIQKHAKEELQCLF